MHTARVYLKTGGYVDVEADIVKCKRNNATGELVSFSCEGTATGPESSSSCGTGYDRGDDDCDKET